MAQDQPTGSEGDRPAAVEASSTPESAAKPESKRVVQDGADRWVASLAVISGVQVQEWDGTADSQICPGCSFSDPSPPIEDLRPSASGSDRDVSPYVGANVEFMSPELELPGRPRFFFGGEISGAFGAERSVALERDPGDLASPLPEGATQTPFSEEVVLGQGSKTNAQLDSLVYGAHIGVSFPLSFKGRALRVKPSFAWTRYKVDVQGAIVDAECQNAFGGTTNCNVNTPVFPGDLREIRLEGGKDDAFNGIGPGLDLELDTGRFGPLGSSLFFSSRFYRILGDRKIEFDASASFPNNDGPGLPPAETRAHFSYKMKPWAYRLGLGFRLQWLGSE